MISKLLLMAMLCVVVFVLTMAIRPSCPDIHDRFTVDVHREGAAAEARTGKQAGKGLNGACETGVGGALDMLRQAVVAVQNSCLCHGLIPQ